MNHDQALRILRWRFPTLCLWFGASTGHWWAYLDGALIEARTPEELGRRVDIATCRAPANGEIRRGPSGVRW